MGMVVLSIIMVTMLFGLMTPLTQSVQENSLVIASFLAQERLEQIFAAKANSGYGYGYITAANFPDETPVAGFTGYSRSVTITEVRGNDLTTPLVNSGFKKIVVKVTWNNGAASLDLTGLLGNY